MIILYCLRFESPQPGGPGPCVYIPRNRVARLHPQALCSLFVASYDSQGHGGNIGPRLHTGYPTTLVKIKVTLRLTVVKSVSLGVEPHLELITRYLLLFDSYGLVFE
jgi:hypothetical protein